MIELGPSLYDVDFDTAWLYTATLYFNDYLDWRFPTTAEYRKFDLRTPLWQEGHWNEVWWDVRSIYPVRTIND